MATIGGQAPARVATVLRLGGLCLSVASSLPGRTHGAITPRPVPTDAAALAVSMNAVAPQDLRFQRIMPRPIQEGAGSQTEGATATEAVHQGSTQASVTDAASKPDPPPAVPLFESDEDTCSILQLAAALQVVDKQVNVPGSAMEAAAADAVSQCGRYL